MKEITIKQDALYIVEYTFAISNTEYGIKRKLYFNEKDAILDFLAIQMIMAKEAERSKLRECVLTIISLRDSLVPHCTSYRDLKDFNMELFDYKEEIQERMSAFIL